MLKFCNKNKGAISVFLTLILLPSMLLAGLTSDAARIYTSKVVISDAGEMAMNAALAQYDTDLLDRYGLFVMQKKPSEIETELKEYFNASLNGSGISSSEDYQKILDLVSEQFSVLEMEGSQIYKTEVEKQQIIEYMKYRAPVCLTELVLEKFDQLKDVQKMADAMEAQLDFAQDMEDCQEAMENAKLALDELAIHIKDYPTRLQMQQTLDETQVIYQTEVTLGILMRSALSKYTESAEMDGEEAVKSYIQAAQGINLGTPIDGGSFEACINAKYYEESAKKLSKIISEHNAAEPEKETEEYESWKTRKEELEELKDSYEDAKATVSGYPNALLSAVNERISTQTLLLADYFQKSVKGQDLAEEAKEYMEVIKEKLEKAKQSWSVWSDKTDALGDNAGQMQVSVDEYGDFFANASSQDVSNLDDLLKIIKDDEVYFIKMQEVLKQEKYFEKSMATVTPTDQYKVYYGKADGVTSASSKTYSSILSLQGNLKNNYEHTIIPENPVLKEIDGHAFYERLKEYCKNTAESESEKNATNQMLNEGAESGKAVNEITDYPTGTLNIDDTCPSKLLAQESQEEAETGELGGDVNGRSGRKKAVKGYKASISAAADFLENLNSILTEGLANLYVAEYAMQMFSYYTIDTKFEDGELTELKDDEIISISGYKLKENKGYLGEVEYILWGNPELASNIKSTVAMIFGIRLLLNSFFAFTNQNIVTTARNTASAIAGSAPYLIPVLQAIIQLGYAALETSDDIVKIKEGKGVTILKDKDSWRTFNAGSVIRDNTRGLTFTYSEYLRVFLNLNMFGDKEKSKLARIGDCIQINTGKKLQDGYTMLGIEAKVKARTTFLKKISDMDSGLWTSPDNTYEIQYQSILGY